MSLGFNCKLREFLLPLLISLIFIHIVVADDVEEELRKAQKLKFQQKEQLLLQMQHEIQVQLQNLYNEQHQQGNDQIGSYEYPSYCANCLGDTFEPASKNLLSSEFSRVNDDETKTSQSESEFNQLSDHRRLEAIKQQILLKLNLREKPNITNSIPKQLVLDTLNHAEEREFGFMQMQMMQSSDSIVEKLQSLKTKASNESTPNSDEDDNDFDDFYGKTREIIIFAEKGHRINNHHILSFSTAIDNQPDAKLKIRMATLWLMVKRQPLMQSPTKRSKRGSQHVNKVNQMKNQKFDHKRRKRRRKEHHGPSDGYDNDKTNNNNLEYFYYENHSFNNHITNDNNNNDNHIIKSNSYDDEQWHDGGGEAVENDTLLRSLSSAEYKKFAYFTQFHNKSHEQNASTNQNDDIDNKTYRHKHMRHNVTLWIFRVHDTNLSDYNSAVDYDFTDEKLRDRIEFSVSKEITLSKLGWNKVDVTSLLKKWYAEHYSKVTLVGNKESRLQLFIDCTGCVRNHLQVQLLNDKNLSENEQNKPFLVVNIEPNIVRRTRRRAIDCSNAGRSQCCKQRFYVSFKTLGWDDWIIAPPGYYANYCRGDCGNGIHRTPDTLLTYYSHVFHEVRKYSKLNGNQLCCAPLKYSSMSLIYFGPDGKIIKRDLPKMVVDECGCP
ncbi:hypothetical protein PVAND_017565 [Polypedilum vanderplanki]|uniref:TGF-beta family profile domain-containing protein n=1 Tax=Polypedilum vanderplanki TaxID=319348 RepID=A0A9J6BIZ5_POLVA|nr:hypothetical protein PVAND_017565 [Polypedilum vanderplanki]